MSSPEHDPESSQMRDEENGSNMQPSVMILEQDRFLPIANISRIMKRVIPQEGKLSKEAKECVQECVSEFLLFITSEASERCANERRKTISGEDLLVAFRTLGFDEFLTPLEEFLRKYREANKLQSSQAVSLIQMGSGGLCDNNAQGTSADETSDPSQPIIYLQEQQLMTSSNLQPVQVFYDATNGQYFIPVQEGGDTGSSSLWNLNLAQVSGELQQHTSKDG